MEAACSQLPVLTPRFMHLSAYMLALEKKMPSSKQLLQTCIEACKKAGNVMEEQWAVHSKQVSHAPHTHIHNKANRSVMSPTHTHTTKQTGQSCPHTEQTGQSWPPPHTHTHNKANRSVMSPHTEQTGESCPQHRTVRADRSVMPPPPTQWTVQSWPPTQQKGEIIFYGWSEP